MKALYSIGFCAALVFSLLTGCGSPLYRQATVTPLQFLKEQEIKHRDAKGEVYLGNVMTLYYPASGVQADERDHPFLLELTDVLKTPLREKYRLVLKGFSDDGGPAELNLRLSMERAEALKSLMVKKYYMKKERITAEAYGETHPVASKETGRHRSRRVEIHVFGDVSEAVRFMGVEEEKK